VKRIERCGAWRITSNVLEQVLSMPRTRKTTSTVERWMQKPGFRAAVHKEAKQLVLSELVLAIMAKDKKSIRELAKELGVSKTVIQNVRSGQQTDMKLSNFVKLTHAYGYHLTLEKEGERINL
jgi:transcriptional antiterminator